MLFILSGGQLCALVYGCSYIMVFFFQRIPQGFMDSVQSGVFHLWVFLRTHLSSSLPVLYFCSSNSSVLIFARSSQPASFTIILFFADPYLLLEILDFLCLSWKLYCYLTFGISPKQFLSICRQYRKNLIVLSYRLSRCIFSDICASIIPWSQGGL